MELYNISIIESEVIFEQTLSTRLNMKETKVQNNVDATQVFEYLCAEIARNYFGTSTESLVFGTAASGGFEKKVKHLISRLGEGDGFKNPNNNPPTAKDDALDIVVWKEFADKRHGKLIGFGQCKTGTSWNNGIVRLKPEKFCSTWFINDPILTPIPIIFISDTLNWEKNFYSIQKNYLFFNRFRIMEYLPADLDDRIITNIRKWLDNALKFLNNNKS